MLAVAGRDGGGDEVELLVPRVEPGAVEPEIGPIAPLREPEDLGVEGDRRDNVVDVDGHMVHAKGLHAHQFDHMTRMLVVGPIGARPWMPMDELVAELEAIGHEVVVNGDPQFVLPMPESVPPRLGAFVSSAPGLASWWSRMFVRWRRTARRSLERSGIDQVLVWDDLLALLCCLARPRGVEVLWVDAPPEGDRRYQRLLRTVVTRLVDRVVTAPAPVARRDATPTVDGWVVFGSSRPVTHASLARLRARAAVEPALALLFDARTHDEVMPAAIDALVEAANPRAVWWVCDDEWVARLGGLPRAVVDVSDDVEPDHRHLRMAGTSTNDEQWVAHVFGSAS
jgi:hypothetical protein